MNPDPSTALSRQRDQLRAQVLSLPEEPAGEERRDLLTTLLRAADPVFAGALEQCFQHTATGRAERLRMEVDVLRRLSRSGETEQIFRPYGVLELATPVRLEGRTRYAVLSGPLKVSPWTAQERETLAKLSGMRISELPRELAECGVWSPQQIQALKDHQAKTAAWVAEAFSVKPSAAPVPSALPEASSLDILQPGFAEHLEVLFASIQREAAEGSRIARAATRGRHLTEQMRRISEASCAERQPISVHSMLAAWTARLEAQHPHLRIRNRLEAEDEVVNANPHRLHHLLYTLLAAIVDGLPEGRALLGVSTRNDQRAGRPMLHLEIRDGGGLATFAGVAGETETAANTAAEEGAEWTVLASRLDAEIRILRDADTVTRAELFLPLASGPDGDPTATGTHQLWIVEDDDREYETMLRMLQNARVACTRFRSAAELQDNFATAKTAPDLVLLKYYLPDMRGAEVRQWLFEQDSSLPVILISGLDTTHPGIATLNRLPSTLYLQKPFDSAALLDMVRMNLDDTLAG